METTRPLRRGKRSTKLLPFLGMNAGLYFRVAHPKMYGPPAPVCCHPAPTPVLHYSVDEQRLDGTSYTDVGLRSTGLSWQLGKVVWVDKPGAHANAPTAWMYTPPKVLQALEEAHCTTGPMLQPRLSVDLFVCRMPQLFHVETSFLLIEVRQHRMRAVTRPARSGLD